MPFRRFWRFETLCQADSWVIGRKVSYDPCGSVPAAVIDNNDLERNFLTVQHPGRRGEHGADGAFFILSGNDNRKQHPGPWCRHSWPLVGCEALVIFIGSGQSAFSLNLLFRLWTIPLGFSGKSLYNAPTQQCHTHVDCAQTQGWNMGRLPPACVVARLRAWAGP